MPSQEQFDAMNDCQFCDWWDVWFARQQASAENEDQVDQAQAEMNASFNARWN